MGRRRPPRPQSGCGVGQQNTPALPTCSAGKRGDSRAAARGAASAGSGDCLE